MANTPNVLGVNLKLLQLFVKIVDHGGFAAAQAALNIGQSTISTQMAVLEKQIGMRLCQRGRVGFRLTAEGEQVYTLCKRLFGAVGEFQGDVNALRGQLTGALTIGIVDSTATNPRCRISAAIAKVKERPNNNIVINVTIAAPDDLELAVMEGRCQVAIGAFFHHSQGLRYDALFDEEQTLLCGRGHPLFGVPEDRLAPEQVSQQAFIAHGYARQQAADFAPVGSAFHMEALAFMILSGRYIGYLPVHYAAQWTDRGEMWPLLPRKLNYWAKFEVATRRVGCRSMVIDTFLADLFAAHGRQNDEDGAAVGNRRTGRWGARRAISTKPSRRKVEASPV